MKNKFTITMGTQILRHDSRNLSLLLDKTIEETEKFLLHEGYKRINDSTQFEKVITRDDRGE